MALFSFVFLKVFAILLNIVIGYFSGKYSDVSKKSIASLLFYFIAPIVFFSIPARTKVDLTSISIALVVFIIASSISIVSYYFFKKIYKDGTANILAMSAGAANTGYFMLPLAIWLFDDKTLTIYMMAVVGTNIYEVTIGYYLCARSSCNVKESISRIIKLPILNAFLLGCSLGFFNLTIPDFLTDFIENMQSAYAILGMIMVGLGMSEVKNFEIDKKFIALAFFAKFILYPFSVNCFIGLDKYLLCIYTTEDHNALQLIAMAPIAANVIVFASIMNLNSEKVATSVLLSCIFAVLYIPFMVSLLLNDLRHFTIP